MRASAPERPLCLCRLSGVLSIGHICLLCARELAERARRKVSRGGLYLVLERVVKKRYLILRMGEPSAERGGRAKRFFQLTDEGREALRVSGRSLLALWDGMDFLLEDGP